MSDTPISLGPERDPWLNKQLARVNARFFRGRLHAAILWSVPVTHAEMPATAEGLSPVPAAGYRWDRDPPEIHIHPYLRHHRTPLFVIRYCIHHEGLHQLFPPKHTNTGVPAASCIELPEDIYHPPEFMEHEIRIPYREKALRWLQRNGFPVLPYSSAP